MRGEYATNEVHYLVGVINCTDFRHEQGHMLVKLKSVLFNEIIIPVTKPLSTGYECMRAKRASVIEWEKCCILLASPFIKVTRGNKVKILEM